MIISQNDKAILLSVPVGYSASTHFEVWILMEKTVGKNKGELITPKDEDFGCWAWNFYTIKAAQNCFDEITTGKRTFRPNIEATEI